MKRVTIYQTVQNRDNADQLETDGPIISTDNTWLGIGSYFWDTYIENAEWWGESYYKGNYMIFNSSYDKHSDNLFDLVGDMEHIELLSNAKENYSRRFNIQEITVATVIESLKKDGFLAGIHAIRAKGIPRKMNIEKLIPFNCQGNRLYYTELKPKVQLCVMDVRQFLTAPYRYVKSSGCNIECI